MVMCLELSADCLHMVWLMPLPSKIPSSLSLKSWYRRTQVVLEKDVKQLLDLTQLHITLECQKALCGNCTGQMSFQSSNKQCQSTDSLLLKCS